VKMKQHLKIFFSILGKVLLVLIIPAFFYGVFYGVAYLLGAKEYSSSIETFVLDIFTLLFIFLFFKYYLPEVQKAVTKGALSVKLFIKLIPISLLVRLPLVVIIVILYIFFGDVVNEVFDKGIEFQWSVFDDSSWWTVLLGFSSFVIIGPIHEELFFRGVIQRYLASKYSTRSSLIYTSIVFALVHIEPSLIISTFFLGIALGYISQKWNNIWYAIVLHMLINLQPFIIQLLDRG